MNQLVPAARRIAGAENKPGPGHVLAAGHVLLGVLFAWSSSPPCLSNAIVALLWRVMLGADVRFRVAALICILVATSWW